MDDDAVSTTSVTARADVPAAPQLAVLVGLEGGALDAQRPGLNLPGACGAAPRKPLHEDVLPAGLHEVKGVLADVARDDDRVGVAERAEALAVDAVAHVEEQVEVGAVKCPPLPLENHHFAFARSNVRNQFRPVRR